MDLDTRLTLLKQIYARHNAFFEHRERACRKFCSACCTCNVTMTTLEGYVIVSSLDQAGQLAPTKALEHTLAGKRFQPRVTTNGFAELCMQGNPVPEEPVDPAWGTCPFLEQNVCTIYPARPFGCRAMMSVSDCRQTGVADMDELALTVNNTFLQVIEHLDITGFFGNLSDIIQFLMADGTMTTYRRGDALSPPRGLVRNQAIKLLMVPPEHRAQIEPLLRSFDVLFT